MSQAPINQLLQILKIREQTVLEAAKNWQLARDQFHAGKTKHEQLLVYRQDYVEQLHQLGNAGCEIGRMRNRIEFITQLDQALGQMNQHLASLAKQRSQLEKNYLQAKAEQDVVLELLKKLYDEKKNEQERLDQKESDEYALKQWYSKGPITHSKKTGD
ncbi:flagellar protein FliJ [Legionella quinlivanii]|uniref:Flagellar FliJ protein n=1 Tax=Legionella quinlivanii TaxID=45073 RepID=A0A0W0XXE6_9GAMM|nr:flagellar export protein FliJ [Legionella quinlivanii]KTD49151.1 flagellar protein FliJ [Legionella quinlivanii]MCW8450191.1 flagellar export protein FliJ [Legionella quinlivanii]SEG42937.1 flagellar FliJ protein [Legionella quinlivanii DSM 21216]STY11661.1 flagellar FliJ protein [Legionella quinlivanii]